jgi:hypothetical protein
MQGVVVSDQRGRELRREVAQELERLGIEAVFGMTNGQHQVAVFYIGGQRRKYFFPLTPGDGRATKKAVSGVRRLVRGVHP